MAHGSTSKIAQPRHSASATNPEQILVPEVPNHRPRPGVRKRSAMLKTVSHPYSRPTHDWAKRTACSASTGAKRANTRTWGTSAYVLIGVLTTPRVSASITVSVSSTNAACDHRAPERRRRRSPQRMRPDTIPGRCTSRKSPGRGAGSDAIRPASLRVDVQRDRRAGAELLNNVALARLQHHASVVSDKFRVRSGLPSGQAIAMGVGVTLDACPDRPSALLDHLVGDEAHAASAIRCASHKAAG